MINDSGCIKSRGSYNLCWIFFRKFEPLRSKNDKCQPTLNLLAPLGKPISPVNDFWIICGRRFRVSKTFLRKKRQFSRQLTLLFFLHIQILNCRKCWIEKSEKSTPVLIFCCDFWSAYSSCKCCPVWQQVPRFIFARDRENSQVLWHVIAQIIWFSGIFRNRRVFDLIWCSSIIVTILIDSKSFQWNFLDCFWRN